MVNYFHHQNTKKKRITKKFTFLCNNELCGTTQLFKYNNFNLIKVL